MPSWFKENSTVDYCLIFSGTIWSNLFTYLGFQLLKVVVDLAREHLLFFTLKLFYERHLKSISTSALKLVALQEIYFFPKQIYFKTNCYVPFPSVTVEYL